MNTQISNSGVLSTSSRLIAIVEDFLTAIAAIGILVIMVFGISEIVLRLIFNIPVLGYLDIIEQSLAVFAFLGVAYTQRDGTHVRMEIFIRLLRGRPLWLLELFGTLTAMFIVAVIIRYSWDYFLNAYQVGDSTSNIEFPTWPSKLLVPVAFSLWLIRLTIQAVGFLRLLFHPYAQPVAVPIIKEAAEHAKDKFRDVLGDKNNMSSNNKDDPTGRDNR